MKINLKYYRQTKDYSCGPACLKMIFEYFGKKYPEQKLINLCQANKKYGTSHKNLLRAIKKEKLKSHSKNKGCLQDLIDCLNSHYLTIINYLEPSSNTGHYAIVIKYNKKNLILADPLNGNNFIIPWRELNKRWYNNNKTSKGWFVAVKK